jgi:hypothetical protein
MREAHRQAFWKVADESKVWIGVRETNSLAEKHIGVPGYHPKPEDCKAKTSDNQSHPLAGLVINPYVKSCQTAFLNLSGAQKMWLEFLTDGRVAGGANRNSIPTDFYDPTMFPRHYKLETKGRFAGALLLMATHPKNKTGRDCFIHSDYDLMAIVNADDAGNRVADPGPSPFSWPRPSDGRGFSPTAHDATGMHHSAPLSEAAANLKKFHEQIQHDLNNKLRIPMIQHGPEMAWNKGVGAAASEYVIWFGPKYQLHVGMSSMPFTSRDMVKYTSH